MDSFNELVKLLSTLGIIATKPLELSRSPVIQGQLQENCTHKWQIFLKTERLSNMNMHREEVNHIFIFFIHILSYVLLTSSAPFILLSRCQISRIVHRAVLSVRQHRLLKISTKRMAQLAPEAAVVHHHRRIHHQVLSSPAPPPQILAPSVVEVVRTHRPPSTGAVK